MGTTRRVLYVPQRRRAAVDHLRRSGGTASVQELADHLEVTTETVRQDLNALEARGVLRRVRGRAELARCGDSDQDREARDNTTGMVRAVLSELQFASVAVLDASPFGVEVARGLYRSAPLTLITNNLRAAEILAGRPDITLVTLTGNLDPTAEAVFGDRAVAQLSEVSADVSVVGPAGFSLSTGLSVPSPGLAAVNRAVLRTGRRRIAAVRSSSMGHEAGFAFGTSREVDVLITDAPVPTALVGDARTRPFELRVVENVEQDQI